MLRDAERALLPPRIAVGTNHRAMVTAVDQRVQHLRQRRPWRR